MIEPRPQAAIERPSLNAKTRASSMVGVARCRSVAADTSRGSARPRRRRRRRARPGAAWRCRARRTRATEERRGQQERHDARAPDQREGRGCADHGARTVESGQVARTPPRPSSPIARTTASTSKAPTMRYVAASTRSTSRAVASAASPRAACPSSRIGPGQRRSSSDRASGGTSPRSAKVTAAAPASRSAPNA